MVQPGFHPPGSQKSRSIAVDHSTPRRAPILTLGQIKSHVPVWPGNHQLRYPWPIGTKTKKTKSNP